MRSGTAATVGILAFLVLASCADHSDTSSPSPAPAESSVAQGLDNNCFTDPSQCLRPTVNKVTCYKPGTTTNVAGGYSYSDSAGTDGANAFSGTNYGRYLVYIPTGTQAPLYSSLSSAQQRDILRFMNNLAMSNIGGVPTSTSILNHFAVQPAWGGYKKWYSVDTAFRSDYLIYWNSLDNCAYIMTNLPGWQGAIANITTKYSSVTGPDGQAYDHGPLGLPTSNFVGDAWGNSWQRFTNGYITSRSTGYGDMTMRAYYVGGSAIEDKALAGRYSKFFDYAGASGANSYPLTQDPQCSNSITVNPSCSFGKSGRFTKAIGPYSYVQTMIARTGHAIAYNVGGEIGNRWRSAYGASQPWNGALGFPKSEEIYGGVTQQNFDNGYMTWTGVATIYTPSTCSNLCPASAPTTTCWNTTTGTSTTCGAITCSVSCNWGSDPTDYCYDGTEGNTNSTCGEYGVSRLDGSCLLDPTHAGCNPLKQSNYAAYGVCNDGSIVSVVPDVATRSWTSLTTAEKMSIRTLMDNAATLIGCTYGQDLNQIADVNLDPGGLDATTAAYMNGYSNGGGTGDISCGEVYFNRALGCAFPISKTETPIGTPKVATEAKIYNKWSAAKYTHGLPTSLPHRTFDGTMGWQRFQNSYFTSRYSDLQANYIGGNVYGTEGEGRALAARFGRDFDYYSPTSPLMSQPLLVVHDTACVNHDSNLLYATCGATTSGLVSASSTSTYFTQLHSATGYAVSADSQAKYFALAGSLTPQQTTPDAVYNPTRITLGVGYPTGEIRTIGSVSQQPFTGGKIYSKSGSPTWLVANTMSFAYDAAGGPDEMGYPLEDTPSPYGDAVARTQRFEKGNMHLDAGALEPTIAPEPIPTGPVYLAAGISLTPDGLPVKLSWFNRSGTTSTRIYRKNAGDSNAPKPSPYDPGWTLIETQNNPPLSPTIDLYDDYGATSESKNCYYVDFNGGIVISEVVCTFPRGPRVDNPELRRIELRVRVADVSDAGTDDGLNVSLGWHNSTWIDSTVDDFERNSDHTYFLLPFGLTKLTDITGIRISNPGSDAVCIRDIELYINRNVTAPATCTTANGCVFRKVFGNTSNTCAWIEHSDDWQHGDVVAIGSTEMRASPEWSADLTGLMSFGGLNEAGLRQALEGIAGHYMHKKDYSLKNGSSFSLIRLNNSLGYTDDSSLEVHATLSAYYFLDIVAKTQIYVDPLYYCWKKRTDQIVETQVRMAKPQVNTSISVPLLNLLNLIWWPAVDPAIHLYINYVKHDKIRNIDVSPPTDMHYCFPTSGGLVNGLFACNNYPDNLNFEPSIRSQCRTVAVLLGGNKAGSVDTLPASDAIQCPAYTENDCLHPFSDPYGYATQVYVHATAEPGSVFMGWNVDLPGSPYTGCVSVAGTQGEFCYVNTQYNPIVTATFCLPDQLNCDGMCKDPMVDEMACGNCGTQCSPTQQCLAGVCTGP